MGRDDFGTKTRSVSDPMKTDHKRASREEWERKACMHGAILYTSGGTLKENFLQYLFLRLSIRFGNDSIQFDRQNKSGHGSSDPIGEAALPNRGAVGGWRGPGSGSEPGHGEGGVEVLPDLGNYPIRDGPGVDPGDVPVGIAALDEDGGADRINGERDESERIGRRRCGAGEDAHQKLARRRAVEPPLEVGVQKLLDQIHVARSQGLIQGEHHPLVSGFFQSFLLSVSQT
ncbi:hypothetical protein DM860_016163 [Cuscuta australis]|uniref:Uncharacterized protein n=1 Tax=Cuscuta australis TaxID=267555 RepID=A0A328E2R5_9ASTE|nr:hypothetical protein DM860_016163 [Cuscuta australis]